jgi:hypothetical protein
VSLTAYETGVASSPADLLDKMETFAGSNGWTVSTPTSGKVFRKDTIVVGASSDSDELFLRGAITYNSGAAWNAQDNNSGQTLAINLGTGPFTAYHFFLGAEDGNDYFHGVVEVSANIFNHFAFGRLVRSGTYDGGVYVEGTRWSTSSNQAGNPNSASHITIADANGTTAGKHLWIDHDSKTNNWQSGVSSTAATSYLGNGRNGGMLNVQLINIGFQRYNMRTPLWPAQLFVRRASSLISLAGRLPDFRHVSIENFVPGDIITIGGVDWMLFPIRQKTDTASHTSATPQNSYYQGYAYRKN